MRKFTTNEIREFVAKAHFDEGAVLRKDSSWPRISIVTPSYNQGRFLERTILSVLNQDYPNLEYIIMDGRSSDNSVETIRKYERYLAYWKSQKDEGQAHAIQQGFRRCSGHILAYLNSDDVYLPGTLRTVGAVFRSRPSVQVLYGNRYLVDEEDRIIGERRLVPCHAPRIARLGLLYGGFGIYQPASFWRRDLYYSVGEIDIDFVHCMDNDLFARFSLAGARFHFVREHLAGFRIHLTSKTSNLSHVAEKERAVIRARYAQGDGRLLLWASTQVLRVIRIGSYIVQGDAFYVLKRKLYRKLTWVP
jgi:glycosyltransferase involved in cell wall biosynthesis